MLKTRIISAIIGLAIVIPAILYSPLMVKALVLFATTISIFEYFHMMLPHEHPKIRNPLLVLSLLFTLILMYLSPSYLGVLSFFTLVGVMSIFLFFQKDLTEIPKQVGTSFFGIFYISFTLVHFVFLHRMQTGPYWILWIMAGTFLGDTGAYLFGKNWGRHKLLPRVSPGKTWEGFAGQIIGAFLGVFLWKRFFMPYEVTWQDALAVALICAILGPLGDLCESMLKRASGTKDSGKFMPGHGGLLDRIDGLLFTAPAVYYYMFFISFG